MTAQKKVLRGTRVEAFEIDAAAMQEIVILLLEILADDGYDFRAGEKGSGGVSTPSYATEPTTTTDTF